MYLAILYPAYLTPFCYLAIVHCPTSQGKKLFQNRPAVVTSQIPVNEWYNSIGEKTIADAILDCIVHNSPRAELYGESLRRSTSKSESVFLLK